MVRFVSMASCIRSPTTSLANGSPFFCSERGSSCNKYQSRKDPNTPGRKLLASEQLKMSSCGGTFEFYHLEYQLHFSSLLREQVNEKRNALLSFLGHKYFFKKSKEVSRLGITKLTL